MPDFDSHLFRPFPPPTLPVRVAPLSTRCRRGFIPFKEKAKIMTLYARSDLMSVSVPVASGGCGGTHSRPVRDGAPARDFRLDCPGCETFLKGGGRTVLTTVPGDKE